jgi:starvation-inducible DNA-binding protein
MLFTTKNNLSRDVAERMTVLLNTHLVMSIDAQCYSKFLHWNVKGEGFFSAHKLFDKVYEMAVEHTDKIAERITAIGGEASGATLQLSLAWTDGSKRCSKDLSVLSSADVHACMINAATMLANLANSYRAAIKQSVDDAVTQNLYLALTEEADHMLYFVEAHLRA